MTVVLGRVGPDFPGRFDRHGHEGCLYYVDGRELVVLAVFPVDAHHWMCGVIAGRRRDAYNEHSAGRIRLSTSILDRAATAVTLDPDTDGDGWAMCWQAAVMRTFQDGHLVMLARTVADILRHPGTRAVEVDQAIIDHLDPGVIDYLHVVDAPDRVGHMVDELVQAGLLTPVPATVAGSGSHLLTIPGAETSTEHTGGPA